MTHLEARDFFIKHESYFTSDLPGYLNFNSILKKVDKILQSSPLSLKEVTNAGLSEEVNHIIYSNKDGKYDWRPLQLINPVLYVSLVHAITDTNNWKLIKEKFNEYKANPRIICSSVPVLSQSTEKDRAEQIKQWWHGLEQKSIELALDFDYIFNTDITNCYGSIYTHAIPWAIHSKPIAKLKENRNNYTLIGNVIDLYLRGMNFGQTNGIPQGSIVMDFIAEIVLGYGDSELTHLIKKAKIMDYTILRYRDDYRIFVNNPQDGEKILKYITEVMIGLGMKLHTSKTFSSDEVIINSIKEDKLAWNNNVQYDYVRRQLLQIYKHSLKYPNAGSLCAPLDDINRILPKKLNEIGEVLPIISIIVDLAVRNPRVISVCFSLISILQNPDKTCNISSQIVNKIRKKFQKLPDSGLLDIWLQRITLPCMKSVEFEEQVCNVVFEVATEVKGIPYKFKKGMTIWNIEWISTPKLKKAVDPKTIILKSELMTVKPRIQEKEIKLFKSKLYDVVS